MSPTDRKQLGDPKLERIIEILQAPDQQIKEEAMEKIQVYIHAEYNEWDKKFIFSGWRMNMSLLPQYGPLVGEHEFEFEPPSLDAITGGLIQQYREQQKSILAEAEMRRAALDQKINDLLAIEYKPEKV